MPRDIRCFTRDELAARFQAWGEPTYRVDQLLHWLYERRVTRWEQMTNLPKALRERLAGEFGLGGIELACLQTSRDSTRKFLWRLRDRALVESVLIPANPALYGESSDRHTLCVSTQVGCAYGCRFCASGLEGWKRNLTADEIVEQVLAVERWHAAQPSTLAGQGPAAGPVAREERSEPPASRTPILNTPFARGKTPPESQDITGGGWPADPGPSSLGVRPSSRLIDNLVLMGMGEPLANYDELLQALRILNAPWGGGIGARKITISTSGLVPQIRRLADEPLQFRLALSLHGATDDVRSRLMPVNRKYPLQELIAACEYYQQRKGRMITFEYILIAGVNDDPRQAVPLARLARRLHAKVNLIPYNTVEGLPWQRPDEAAQERFLAAVKRCKVPVTLRREKGHDIDAACGQLRWRTERELAAAGDLVPR